jgi:hypothetical protein
MIDTLYCVTYGMITPEPPPSEPPVKPSRQDEARRIIKEYVSDLREIMKEAAPARKLSCQKGRARK